MRVTPTGASEYHNGGEIGRYGRDGDAETYFVWYHNGLRRADTPKWAMDTDVEWKISISVDTILVADENNGLYAIDRDAFVENVQEMDGREQYVISADDDGVDYYGDPNDYLRGNLWVTCDNGHGGYHKDKNES
jgi:hypothetical protein